MTPAPTPPTNPANPVPAPAPSPTGTPISTLLGKPAVAIGLYLAAVLSGAVSQAKVISHGLLDLPPAVTGWALVVAFICASIGVVSQGARRLVVLLALGYALASSPAYSQALTVGPSLPAFAITPGAGHPLTLAAGAGFTVGADFFPTTVLNQKAHWLTVGADVFGSLVPVDGKVGGNASLALHVCLLGMFCVGGGAKMLDSSGYGALDGKLDHRSFFILFEPDCRVMKLLWPAVAATPPTEAEPREPCDGDHPCAGTG